MVRDIHGEELKIDILKRSEELKIDYKRKNLDLERIERVYNDKKGLLEKYISNKYREILGELDLKGYEILSYNVNYDLFATGDRIFVIMINEMKNPKNIINLKKKKTINKKLYELDIFYPCLDNKKLDDFTKEYYISEIKAG